jgi:hypothetical protein
MSTDRNERSSDMATEEVVEKVITTESGGELSEEELARALAEVIREAAAKGQPVTTARIRGVKNNC